MCPRSKATPSTPPEVFGLNGSHFTCGNVLAMASGSDAKELAAFHRGIPQPLLLPACRLHAGIFMDGQRIRRFLITIDHGRRSVGSRLSATGLRERSCVSRGTRWSADSCMVLSHGLSHLGKIRLSRAFEALDQFV